MLVRSTRLDAAFSRYSWRADPPEGALSRSFNGLGASASSLNLAGSGVICAGVGAAEWDRDTGGACCDAGAFGCGCGPAAPGICLSLRVAAGSLLGEKLSAVLQLQPAVAVLPLRSLALAAPEEPSSDALVAALERHLPTLEVRCRRCCT